VAGSFASTSDAIPFPVDIARSHVEYEVASAPQGELARLVAEVNDGKHRVTE
jgi:hypothetical protein